jgi:hypothetical protein
LAHSGRCFIARRKWNRTTNTIKNIYLAHMVLLHCNGFPC